MAGEVLGALVGWMVALIIAFMFIAILVSIAVYVYFALAWRDIARKLGYKRAWLAWIPVANISMILELGGFHWAWVFLILIPYAGWTALLVLMIMSTWKIFEKRKYPGWLSLTQIIPIVYMVVIGFVAWQKK